MSLYIGVKLDKVISSDILRGKHFPSIYGIKDSPNESDDIYCFSPGYSGLVLSKIKRNSEPILTELSKAVAFNCEFLAQPKVNHMEEGEDTKYKFGWVDSLFVLENLKALKEVVKEKSDFHNSLSLTDQWKWYFDIKNSDAFLADLENFIEVLEIGNKQGVRNMCYSIG